MKTILIALICCSSLHAMQEISLQEARELIQRRNELEEKISKFADTFQTNNDQSLLDEWENSIQTLRDIRKLLERNRYLLLENSY